MNIEDGENKEEHQNKYNTGESANVHESVIETEPVPCVSCE